MSTISFIVPHLCNYILTNELLKGLRASISLSEDFDIIIVDDFSTDGSRDWLASLDDPHIKKIFNSENIGYARSNNKGAAAAQGDVLVLLNNDLLFKPGWLQPMLALLDSPALNAGLVGNRQYRVDDGELDHAGIEMSYGGKLDHLRAVGDELRQPPVARPVFAVTGACCVIRRSNYEALGGFDERFVNGGEDIDLCMRIRAMGKRVYVAQDSQVLHHVSMSRDRASVQNEHNSRRLYGRWRDQFKCELAGRWMHALLGRDVSGMPDVLDGQLSRAALGVPYGTARVISEALLRRQEARWLRELDGIDPNQDLVQRSVVVWPGAPASTLDGGFQVAELVVKRLHSARNIYACGHRVAGAGNPALRLTIHVNRIQLKVFHLGPEVNFNFGVIDPLVLPVEHNRFTVTVDFAEPADGQSRVPAAQCIAVTHFVLDDQTVPCKAIAAAASD
jgi:GT2 family glycosyltransferase